MKARGINTVDIKDLQQQGYCLVFHGRTMPDGKQFRSITITGRLTKPQRLKQPMTKIVVGSRMVKENKRGKWRGYEKGRFVQEFANMPTQTAKEAANIWARTKSQEE
jgi:hypothetical protein